MSARRTILVVAFLAAAAGGGGLVATRFISSPAEAAAKTAPPPAGPITVTVGKSPLTSTVTTRGDLGFDGSVEITLPAGSGSPGLVTGRIPKAGGKLTEGAVLLEVSGRPVIALGGPSPGYRSIGPGSAGTDVEQLQKALNRLGLKAGKEDGVYDAEAAAAVEALYRKAGYPAPDPDPALSAAAEAAKAGVSAAEHAVSESESALEAARVPPAASARLAADGAVSAAAAAVETAENTGTPADQSAVGSAQQQLSDADAKLQAAQQELAGAQQALAAVEEELKGAKPDQRPALEQARNSARDALAGVQQKVDQASGEVSTAQDALGSANQPGPPDQSAISAAENQLAVAQAQRNELLAGPDTSGTQKVVAAALQELKIAQKAVRAAKSKLLTPVPLGEIVYLEDLPRRVDEVLVKAGSGVADPVMSVSGEDLQVRATVSEEEAGLLQKGMASTLTVPGFGTLAATVVSVEMDSENAGSWIVLLDPGPVTDVQAQALRGQNVKVDIEVGATNGDVLTVPVGSLFSDSDGTPRVEVLESDGRTRFQRLRVGLTADGEVEVHPIADDGTDVGESEKTLQAGSLVVVGR